MDRTYPCRGLYSARCVSLLECKNRESATLCESGPPIEHITETAMEPAFAGSVIASTVDVLVEYMCVVSAESFNFLLETKPCVLHKLGVAAVPKLAVPLNGPSYRVADRFDHVFVQHFAVDRRKLLMPVHNLWSSPSGRAHDQYFIDLRDASGQFT